MPQDRARQTGPTTFDVGLYSAGLADARDAVRRATPEQLAALTDDERALLIEQGVLLPSRNASGSLLSMLAQAPLATAQAPLVMQAQRQRPLDANQWLREQVIAPAAGWAGRTLGSLFGALDAPPSRSYPADAPYASPLRMLSAANAVLPAAAGVVYDAATGRRPSRPVVDPMRPAEAQATFAGEAARRGAPSLVQLGGTLADFVVGPEHGLQGVAAAGSLLGAGGFYSRLERAAATLPAKGMKAESVLNALKRAPEGLSTEELAWRRVPEFLESRKGQVVTPADLQAHLEANPLTVERTLYSDKAAEASRRQLYAAADALDSRIEAVMRARGEARAKDAWADYWRALERGDTKAALAAEIRINGASQYRTDTLNARQMAREAASGNDSAREWLRLQGFAGDDLDAVLRHADDVNRYGDALIDAPYGEWQEPGGTDYSVSMLKMPPDANAVAAATQRVAVADAEVSAARARYRNLPERERWDDSSHSEVGREYLRRIDEADAAWISAVNEQRNAKGFTHVHFPNDHNPIVHTRANTRALSSGELGRFIEEVQSDLHQLGKKKGYGDASTGLAPDLPFKDAWPELGLKQQLLEAAQDPEAQWLGFTTGTTQAKRYDLSHHVESVVATRRSDGTYLVVGNGPAGSEVARQIVPWNKLDTVVGKELSDKIQSQTRETQRYSGIDLSVGGEGMREFYDKLLPKRLEKLVKPFGGRVEQLRVAAGKGKTAPAWVVRLTPEMKRAILTKGLPLLSLGGIMATGARPQEVK